MDPGGYVDELAAQFVYTESNTRATPSDAELGDDTSATLLYALTDHNANLIALTDSQGHVAAQYSYTPYGEPLHAGNSSSGGGAEFASSVQGSTTFGSLASAESVLAVRGNRIGHQGLRAERFDRPWDSPLDPSSASSADGYRVVYHNRNRMYEPAEGRFLSQDLNELALPVLGSMAYGGMAIGAWHIAPDVKGHFGDGMNAHGAYRGTPLLGSDPAGLFTLGDIGMTMGVSGLVGGLISGYLNRNGPGGFALGFGVGFTAGAIGGGVGLAAMGAASAFGASASGLYAAIAAGASGGGVASGLQGFTESYYLRGSSFKMALADAAWSTTLGAAFGGAGGTLGKGVVSAWRSARHTGVQQADDVVLRVAAAPTGGYLARVVDGHRAGQFFTAVYNRTTQRVNLMPSHNGPPPIPKGWVPRRGGHAEVANELGGSTDELFGFGVRLQGDGSLSPTWYSGTLNGRFPGREVPAAFRNEIIRSIAEATGRIVAGG